MAIDLPFRRCAVRTLSKEIDCYVLCDLDQVPIYVGQSVGGIRSRVNRHWASARSDIIANRQIDGDRMGLGLSGQRQSRDQPLRRRVVS